MDDIYKNIEEYNPNKEYKILIVFDDMIANILTGIYAAEFCYHRF